MKNSQNLTRYFLFIALLFSQNLLATPPKREIKRNMVITESMVIKRAFYLFNADDSLNKPLLTIRGNGITVDFNLANLHGSNDKQLPNQFYGLAILIEGNNITLKNAHINGYKIAVMAKNCKNLRIINSNFSYNYKQHLQSNWLNEDVSDWMSYHHNEQDEWLRYGAGLYLKDCKQFTIAKNTITDGQCGLLMVRCEKGTVSDNNFSFNSGLGIGMYRSSNNNILHNQLDFNVRGYSHGFYYRGQDSGGILVFEQCNENVFAYNSATHSGDGFFLWAGQTTMDKGTGGCNDNYIYQNDFSYAPTNGVELTFSKNHIINNIINECDHGIWGGYSWETSINGNTFHKNRIGIAIEHGQHNNISFNNFDSNREAGIKLWARKLQPSDWVYAQKIDTRSQYYDIGENKFNNEKNGIDLTLTEHITLYKNGFSNTQLPIKKDSSVQALILDPVTLFDTTGSLPPIIGKWKNKSIPKGNFPYGKNQIKMTEWGPYNFKYPYLFLKKIDSNKKYYFDVLGPEGEWTITNSKDMGNSSCRNGHFPQELIVEKSGEDLQLQLTYTGKAFVNQFGVPQPANTTFQFGFRDYTPTIHWEVNWYKWTTDKDPNKMEEAIKNITENDSPFKTTQTNTLNYTWWGAVGKQLPADSFITVANAIVDLKKGTYRIGLTADDLVRVYVDGKRIIDYWDAGKYIFDEDAHHEAIIELEGKHAIRIEHVENAGYATLIFQLQPL